MVSVPLDVPINVTGARRASRELNRMNRTSQNTTRAVGGLNRVVGLLSVALSAVTFRSVICLLYTSPSPRDRTRSRMPSSA